MKGLTGEEAARRLDQRGGQVWVFRMGHGTNLVFDCVGREGGAAIVVGHPFSRGPAGHDQRFVLRTDADREALTRAMDAARDGENARIPGGDQAFVLTHRDLTESDAGYAQIGCVLALASIVVGLVIGALGAWLATGRIASGAWVIGPIVGYVVGFFGFELANSIAVRIPVLRDRIGDLAYGWFAVVPGLVTAVTVVALTVVLGHVLGA